MQISDTLKISVKGLSTHRGRSLLTILGIVIGITSITLVNAIGDSAKKMILSEVESLGSNNVFILPGKEPTGPTDAGGSILNDSLTIRDLESLKNKSNVPDVMDVAPVVFGPIVASRESETYSTMVIGTSPELFEIYKLNLSQGEVFAADDVAQLSSNIVIGSKVADELFGQSDIIGEKIKFKNGSFRVIGVLEEKGQSSFVNFDEVIVAPYTTVQQQILGFRYIQRIGLTATSPEAVPGLVQDIKSTLRDNHNIEDPKDDDFYVTTMKELANSISTVTTVLTVLLGSVAGISLVVGGVGIMNIMLVSVTERTREIGLRKALGATNGDILKQFLTEAIILTVSGGIIGILLGGSLSYLATVVVNRFWGINFPFAIPVSGMILGVSVSTAIGFVFGIYPARQASKKSPMDALRYE